MLRFDWDDANRNHIARHDVLPHEAEEALNSDTLESDTYEIAGEDRFEELGTTDSGRVLFVVTVLRRGRIRVITAFDATRVQKLQFYKYYSELYE